MAGMSALALTQFLHAAELTGKEKSFVKDALQASMTESKLGEVGKEKATNQQAKDFAAMMTMDHGNSNAELKAYAEKNGVQYENALDMMHQHQVDKLSKLSGGEFDQEFADQMVKDHEKVVKDFEDASGSVQDAELKGLIDKMLPVLRTHLDQARGLPGVTKK